MSDTPNGYKSGKERELLSGKDVYDRLQSALYLIEEWAQEFGEFPEAKVFVVADSGENGLYIGGSLSDGIIVPFDRMVENAIGPSIPTEWILDQAAWFRKLADAIEARAYNDEDGKEGEP